MNQANFLFGYEVITMIIVLVTTKEKSLGTDFNQENWMLVIRLQTIDCGQKIEDTEAKRLMKPHGYL